MLGLKGTAAGPHGAAAANTANPTRTSGSHRLLEDGKTTDINAKLCPLEASNVGESENTQCQMTANHVENPADQMRKTVTRIPRT